MKPYPHYHHYSQLTECKERPVAFPPQHQPGQPGLEYLMIPRPIFENPEYTGSGKLKNKAAFISGGDSGIGRAVAIAFAKEGADIAFSYLQEHTDAEETKQRIIELGRRCLSFSLDMSLKASCTAAVEQTVQELGKLDIVVNNQAIQFPQKSLLDISEEQLELTFRTNFYNYVFVTQAALPYLQSGSAIINTASILAFHGQKLLIDYSSTKGAVITFTRSMASSLAENGIRVNAVAPGPVWTPLVASTFPPGQISIFGIDTPMKRAAQPFEIAPTYVYLASDDSRYVTGETLHINGGDYMA